MVVGFPDSSLLKSLLGKMGPLNGAAATEAECFGAFAQKRFCTLFCARTNLDVHESGLFVPPSFWSG